MTKKRKYDLMLVCMVLLAAAVLYVLFRPGADGAWVVVARNGEEETRYPLEEDSIITLENEDGFNILQILNGAASVIDADCGDFTCVHTGEIKRSGETIVCLPHKLIIRIEGGEETDIDGLAQ